MKARNINFNRVMERYCQKCGKKLTDEPYNFCYNCHQEQELQDKLWDEYFDNIDKKNKEKSIC